MNNENGWDSELFVFELDGVKRRTILCVCNNAEDAAMGLLNSSDERDIESINVIINRLLKTGKDQFVTLDVDCDLGPGERLKNRCLVRAYLAD